MIEGDIEGNLIETGISHNMLIWDITNILTQIKSGENMCNLE